MSSNSEESANSTALKVKARLDMGWTTADRKTKTVKTHCAMYNAVEWFQNRGDESRSRIVSDRRTNARERI